MSYTNDQWRAAVTKLLTMTSKNDISWDRTKIYDGDAWTVVDGALSTQIGDKLYIIAQTRTKYYFDEDAFNWNLGYDFLIYQDKGFDEYERIAKAPELSSLSGLYEAAENSLAFSRNALGGLI